MTPKTKTYLAIASAALVIVTALPNLVSAEDTYNAELGAAVTTVKLRGAGTALQVSTVTGTGRNVTVTAEDNIGCSFDAALTQQDDTLVIEVIKSGFRFGPLCDPDVTIAMPESLALDIGVENLAADINGTFGDVKIRSNSSVVQFDGAADHFYMHGNQAALRLTFQAEMPEEAVDIDVRTVLSDINFTGI